MVVCVGCLLFGWLVNSVDFYFLFSLFLRVCVLGFDIGDCCLLFACCLFSWYCLLLVSVDC